MQSFERLDYESKKEIKRKLPNRCEVTGTPLWNKDKDRKPELHHQRMISRGGANDLGNLALLSSAIHKRIHSTAFEIKKRTGEDIGDIVFRLTKLAIEEGKADRVFKGENPDIVYARENLIGQMES